MITSTLNDYIKESLTLMREIIIELKEVKELLKEPSPKTPLSYKYEVSVHNQKSDLS